MFAQKVVCAPPSSIAALSSRLLLSLISAGPGYHDYERMVNDDECAVCICMSVFLCVGVFCFVKYHMSQDRSGS